MGRALDLDVAAGFEGHDFSLRQFEHELLDEGGDVVVGAHRAFPLANAEHLVRHLDAHRLLDGDLAGQPIALARLALGDVGLLGRKDRAAAFQHLHPALRAGPAAAAGRGDEEIGVRERTEQLHADG